ASELKKNLRIGDLATDGREAHHIVQATNGKHRDFERARQLLLEHQIDINAAENGVALQSTKPGAKINPGLRNHHGEGLHANDVGGETFRRLDEAAKRGGSDWAKRRQEIINELDRLRNDILEGRLPVVPDE